MAFVIKNGVLEKYIEEDGVTEVIIPDGVTHIGGFAFKDCSILESITIPDSVTCIEDYAFIDCSKLKSVTIPDSITNIEIGVFSGCKNLNAVTIPEGVTSIGSNAFENCSSLESVTISDSVTSIGSNAFKGCKNLKSVTISDSVTSIESGAFEGCKNLNAVTIPDNVTSIGWSAFSGCSSLKSVVISDNVTSIGWSAFSGCSSLKSVVIPNSVTSIKCSAFEGCSSLESVTIPDGVTNIEDYAFKDCSSLKSVIILKGVTYIGEEVFSDCENLKLVAIPDGVEGTFDVSWFEHYPDDFVIINGILISYKGEEKTVTIPDGVTSIGNFAFFGCENLESVIIPDSVTSMEWGAFVNYYEFVKFLTIYGVEVDLQHLINEYSICEVTEELDLILQRNFDELEERDYLEENRDTPDGIDIDKAYSIIAEMFKAHPKDKKIVAFINKNFEKMFSYLSENSVLEMVQKMMDNGFFTRDNIDSSIRYMIDHKFHEAQIMLTEYKWQNFGDINPFDKLTLD